MTDSDDVKSPTAANGAAEFMSFRLPDRDRFSDRDLARLFGVHLGTIYRWRLRGVRGTRLGGYLWGGRLRRRSTVRPVTSPTSAPIACRLRP